MGALSDRGRVRSSNEDRFAVLAAPELVAGLSSVLVVADGVGGHQGGAVASSLVVDHLKRRFTRQGLLHRQADPATVLVRTIVAANSSVVSRAARDPHLAGMASTVTAVVISGDELFLAHVGDSRAYLVRQGGIRQLSRDHSWVAEAVHAGRLDPAQATSHPYRHVVTRAVGGAVTIDVDAATFALSTGDVVVLCTDGLSNLVDDAELLRSALEHQVPNDAARSLVELANARGGSDNITVLVARIGAHAD